MTSEATFVSPPTRASPDLRARIPLTWFDAAVDEKTTDRETESYGDHLATISAQNSPTVVGKCWGLGRPRRK
jgi:ABC-type sulfate transport system substrate-binding protein